MNDCDVSMSFFLKSSSKLTQIDFKTASRGWQYTRLNKLIICCGFCPTEGQRKRVEVDNTEMLHSSFQNTFYFEANEVKSSLQIGR